MTRTGELSRIVDEYVHDAIVDLGARDACFTENDRAWILQNALSLGEIEKATLRIVALRISKNRTQAAALLGMAPVSLTRWLGRRKLLSIIHEPEGQTGTEPRRQTIQRPVS